ncbi:hypothetical protein SCLCIDRAFT_30314 [Scleroderma citrinum Foug A]|uniref:Uncharacterized protein n=1 Tax=Scleroderma citrinum Foug A TaxID=1036808 RepID=A0A0C3DGQ2_9AGAM|nr:hypothetical protein SCLCIDRAFT_30314 [Scleroderma citrinum Foug A]
MEQTQAIKALQGELGHSQVRANEMVDSEHEQLANRDSIIVQQAEAIQQLKDQLANTESTINAQIEKIKGQRDMELAAISRKYNAAICQNNNYKDPRSGDPRPSVSCPGRRIIGALIEENEPDAIPDQSPPPAP